MASQKETTLFDSMYPPGCINMIPGAPGPDFLARSKKVFRDAAAERLKTPDEDFDFFQYGQVQGPPSFLHQLSLFLSDSYQDSVEVDELMLTSGASAGFVHAATALLSRNAVVFVECPTYFLVYKMLNDMALTNIVPIPMEADGLDTSYMEEQLAKLHGEREASSEGYWAMLYTIPTIHNPTGVILGPEKAEKVIELSRKFDVLVLCDDVYNLLNYTDEVPRRLVSYDKGTPGCRHVISNGTFSKILAPGLRVGWIETSKDIRAKLMNKGALYSGGSMNPVTGCILATAMKLNLLQNNLATMKQVYAERMDATYTALKRGLPGGFHIAQPRGGFFLWVTGPKNFNADEFVKLLKEEFKVLVVPGGNCAGPAESQKGTQLDERFCTKNSIRISITFIPKDDLERGSEKICQALKKYHGAQ